jgi:hypothetical protein
VRVGSPRPALIDANQEWELDFAHDVIAAGRNIRVVSVIDAFRRVCLALEVDKGFAGRRVMRVLDKIGARRGRPQAIRCDNGPELTSRQFLAWARERKIKLRHIQPGKPAQSAPDWICQDHLVTALAELPARPPRMNARFYRNQARIQHSEVRLERRRRALYRNFLMRTGH